MPLRVRDPKVGDIVYQPYSPQRVGRIKDVLKDGYVNVEWHDGQVQVSRCSWLNYLQSLIDDHEKKLAGHRARMTAALMRWMPMRYYTTTREPKPDDPRIIWRINPLGKVHSTVAGYETWDESTYVSEADLKKNYTHMPHPLVECDKNGNPLPTVTNEPTQVPALPGDHPAGTP